MSLNLPFSHCEQLGKRGSACNSELASFSCMQDEYPDVFRFTASVFPSEDDDVITSPYNAMLSAAKLVEHADCVLPIENQALIDICSR